jgi:hypothetical protein
MKSNGRITSIEQLVQRCKAVGWDVQYRGGHYRVYTHKGQQLTIPSTPGGGNRSLANAIADAKRSGLEELEAKLTLTAERDRLTRIAEDREQNEKRLKVMTTTNPFEVPQASSSVSVSTSEPAEDLGEVNGVKVVAEAPIMIKTPIMKEAKPAHNGRELMLADGQILYRCTLLGSWREDVDPNEPCNQIFDNSASLFAHMRFHKTAEKPRKKKVVDAPLLDVIPVPETLPSVIDVGAAAPALAPASASASATKELLLTRIEDLAGTLFELGGKLIDARNGLIAVADGVRKMQTETVTVEVPVEVPVPAEIDPELLEKARMFDQMRGFFQR